MKKGIALLSVTFLCGLLSCSQKQSSTSAERLKWNKSTLVEAYDKVGSRNPRWDEPARQALNEFARVRSGQSEELETSVGLAGDFAEEAVKAGCDDPMVTYLYCRFALDHSSKPLAYWQDEFRKTAQKMEGSGYAPLRKFYVDDRTANVLWVNRPEESWPEVSQYRQSAMNQLAVALEDKTLPIEKVSEACAALLDTISDSSWEVTNTWKLIEPPLFKNWPHASASYFIKGQFYYKFAWRARGGGYADSVSTNAWKAFAENLSIAEAAYQKAWSLNPKDVRIPTQMIEMAVSQQKERPEMELWFQRAMQLDTNNYNACMKKLRYLAPKWYGSAGEMLKFGRECVASTNWGGRIPLVLVEAHYQLVAYLPREQQASYWQMPEVWPDIQSAYEKFFQLNPAAKDFRPYYANYAFKCGQWQEFLNQIELLKKSDEGLNPAFWGSQETFDKMVQFATENAKKN